MAKTRTFDVRARFDNSAALRGFRNLSKAASTTASGVSRSFKAVKTGFSVSSGLSSLNRLKSMASSTASAISATFSVAAKAAGAAFAVLGGGVVAAKGLASSSSDLFEAQTKANEIFEDAVPKINAYADSADRAIGLSKRAALDSASGFALLMSNVDGVEVDKMVESSIALTQLAGDLASFHNISSEDATAKLYSGLTGEIRALRSIGIFINDAVVKDRAVVMGLADDIDNVTDSAKILAREDLIFNSPAAVKAAGDFERTSAGLANTGRIFGAAWENAKAQMGEEFMPLFANFLNMLVDKMPAGVAMFNRAVKTVSPHVTNIRDGFAALFNVINAGSTSSIGTGFVGFMRNVGVLINTQVIPAARNFGETVREHWPQVREIAGTVFEFILNFGGKVVNWWKTNWPEISTTAKNAFDKVSAAVVAFVEMVSAFWDRFGDDIIIAAKGYWETIKTVWSTAFDFITSLMEGFTALFEGDWDTFWSKIAEAADIAWEGIKRVARVAWDTMKATAGRKISEYMTTLRRWFVAFPGNAQTWLRGVPDALKPVGAQLIQGLWDGAKTVMGEFANWFIDDYNKLLGLLNKLPGVNIDMVGRFNTDEGGYGPDSNIWEAATADRVSTSASRLRPTSSGSTQNIYIEQHLTALDPEQAASATREAVRRGGPGAISSNGFPS